MLPRNKTIAERFASALSTIKKLPASLRWYVDQARRNHDRWLEEYDRERQRHWACNSRDNCGCDGLYNLPAKDRSNIRC